MSRSHDTLREALGAYALGHLDAPAHPDDVALRDELVAHLTGCDACRAELAELVDVRLALDAIPADDPLRRRSPAPETSAEAGAEVRADVERMATPPGLDARIADALAREASAQPPAPPAIVGGSPGSRASRRRAAAVAAVVGLVVGAAAATTAVLVTRETPTPGPVVVAVPSLTTADGVVASAGIVDHTWGLELRLRMSGLPGGRAYDVRVEDGAGLEYDSGEFLGVTGTTITCSMSSSVLAADARHFEVLDPAGAVVIEGDLPT